MDGGPRNLKQRQSVFHLLLFQVNILYVFFFKGITRPTSSAISKKTGLFSFRPFSFVVLLSWKWFCALLMMAVLLSREEEELTHIARYCVMPPQFGLIFFNTSFLPFYFVALEAYI